MKLKLFGKKLNLLLLASLIAVVLFACGGGDEAPMDTSAPPPPPPPPPAAKQTTSSVPKVIKPITMKKSSKETSDSDAVSDAVLEIITPPTAIDVLEGKAQFRTPGTENWVDVIDAQPIEAGWSIRTLAVSRAVLKFVDGSQLHLKPSTQITIDKFELVNGGPAQGGQRHARIKLDNGDVDFNVIRAESPPNTWVFLTVDGAITIQGTEGSLGRRVSVKKEELTVEDKAKLIVNKKNKDRKKTNYYYIKNQSLILDIEILLKSFFKV